MECTGKAMATIVRGRVVMRDGELLGKAQGQAVRFQETLA
jgi:dihydroorotase